MDELFGCSDGDEEMTFLPIAEPKETPKKRKMIAEGDDDGPDVSEDGGWSEYKKGFKKALH
jgi:hypothetical protein